MTEAQGSIIEIDGDYAVVRMDETGCGRCHEKGGCGGQNISQMFCAVPRTFRVLNPQKQVVGARVCVAIADGAVRSTAALVYGLPLATLFLGALLGVQLWGEPGGMMGAVAGLACGWFVLRRRQAQRARDERFQPFIRT